MSKLSLENLKLHMVTEAVKIKFLSWTVSHKSAIRSFHALLVTVAVDVVIVTLVFKLRYFAKPLDLPGQRPSWSWEDQSRGHSVDWKAPVTDNPCLTHLMAFVRSTLPTETKAFNQWGFFGRF